MEIFNHSRGHARSIVIADRHKDYAGDIAADFDFYFNSVLPPDEDACPDTLDLSRPSRYRIPGFDTLLFFTGFPESATLTEQYIDLLQLRPGHTVLDLGAYCGLASLMFAQAVGTDGVVVAVEPDPENFAALKSNILSSGSATGNIRLINAALWKSDGGIRFDCEGNMGSSAAEILDGRSHNVKILPCLTIASLLSRLSDSRKVDAVKMDIEGAEYIVMPYLSAFLREHRPRIIVELHRPDDRDANNNLIGILLCAGYKIDMIPQPGTGLPLIMGIP